MVLATVAIGTTLSVLAALVGHLAAELAADIRDVGWTTFIASEWPNLLSAVLLTTVIMVPRHFLENIAGLLRDLDLLPPLPQPWIDFFHALQDLGEWVAEWFGKWEWRWSWKREREEDGGETGAWSLVVGCSIR